MPIALPCTHLITAEKGGVGKSVVALALADYLLTRGEQFTVCETDRSNGDVGAAFEGKHAVIYPYFSEDFDEIESADILIETALEGKSIVVNTPAQCHRAMVRWMADGVLSLSREAGFKLLIWFVTSGSKDSISLFLQSLDAFPEIPHILVRNQHFDNRKFDYSDPDAWEPIRDVLTARSVPVVIFPKFPAALIDHLKTLALTFAEAGEKQTEGISVLNKQRIKARLTSFYAQLNTLEVFTDATPEPKSTRRKKRPPFQADAAGDGTHGARER